MTVPQGRITDTFELKQMAYFPFIYADDEVYGFSVKVYRNYGGSLSTAANVMAWLLPDSQPFVYPGALPSKSLVITRVSGDTGAAMALTAWYLVNAPKK
jgi:hypothetical protein